MSIVARAERALEEYPCRLWLPFAGVSLRFSFCLTSSEAGASIPGRHALLGLEFSESRVTGHSWRAPPRGGGACATRKRLGRFLLPSKAVVNRSPAWSSALSHVGVQFLRKL